MENKKKPIFKNLNKRLTGLVFASLIIFFITQIYVTSLIGTKSSEIESIRIQKDEIRLENEILNSKIDNAKSVANIEEIAKKFGLNPQSITELKNSANPDIARD